MFAVRKIKLPAGEIAGEVIGQVVGENLFFSRFGRGDEDMVIFGLPLLFNNRSIAESMVRSLDVFSGFKFEVVELVVKEVSHV